MTKTARTPVGPPLNRNPLMDEALRHDIELRAYYRYCVDGCKDGRDVDDWLAAEREVLAERAARTA